MGVFTGAVLATAVEDDFVVGDLESRRSQLLEPHHALLEIKDILAFSAMEVMVMSLGGSLVARWLSGNLHTADEAILDERLQSAINSGNADGGDGFQGKLMDLVREQGAILFFENGLDGLLLSCGALCE